MAAVAQTPTDELDVLYESLPSTATAEIRPALEACEHRVRQPRRLAAVQLGRHLVALAPQHDAHGPLPGEVEAKMRLRLVEHWYEIPVKPRSEPTSTPGREAKLPAGVGGELERPFALH